VRLGCLVMGIAQNHGTSRPVLQGRSDSHVSVHSETLPTPLISSHSEILNENFGGRHEANQLEEGSTIASKELDQLRGILSPSGASDSIVSLLSEKIWPGARAKCSSACVNY